MARRTTAPPLPETQLERRGHLFYPPHDVPVPALYKAERVPADEKTVWLHYFVAACDWWIVEYDPVEGLAFGYALLNGDWDNAEWGYVSLPELEAINAHAGLLVVERDCYWEPRPFADVMRERRR